MDAVATSKRLCYVPEDILKIKQLCICINVSETVSASVNEMSKRAKKGGTLRNRVGGERSHSSWKRVGTATMPSSGVKRNFYLEGTRFQYAHVNGDYGTASPCSKLAGWPLMLSRKKQKETTTTTCYTRGIRWKRVHVIPYHAELYVNLYQRGKLVPLLKMAFPHAFGKRWDRVRWGKERYKIKCTKNSKVTFSQREPIKTIKLLELLKHFKWHPLGLFDIVYYICVYTVCVLFVCLLVCVCV